MTTEHQQFMQALNSQNQQNADIPLFDDDENPKQMEKGHRVNLQLAGENTGLRANLRLEKIFSNIDSFEMGGKMNFVKQVHQWFTYATPFTVPNLKLTKFFQNKQFLTSTSYEIDNKHLKYLSREHSFVFRAQQEQSPWSFQAESVLRKNLIDQYASRELIYSDNLPSVKHSVSLNYSNMDPYR